MTVGSQTQASLFSAAPAATAESAAKTPDVPRRLFVVTNRYNLLEFLSSGMIYPAEAIPKYYDDLLAFSPGRVPVLAAPFDAEVIARSCAPADSACFPVAIEINASRLESEKLPALRADGSPDAVSLQADGAVMWAVTGAIPLSAAVGIHFRSQSELREHSARKYENIFFPSTVALVVSPGLFEPATARDLHCVEWLASLASNGHDGSEYQREDRDGGAIALLARSLPQEPSSILSFARLIDTHSEEALAGSPPRRPAKAKKGKKPDRAETAPPAGESSSFPEWILPVDGRVSRTAETERRLFDATLNVLRNADPRQKWRVGEILEQVQSSISAAPLSDTADAELRVNLDSVRAVASLERDFRPLSTGKGLSVAKALLMVLLRPDPASLLAWDPSESGADDTVRMTAAYFSGALNGRKRLPTSLRSPELDAALAERSAARLSNRESAFTNASIAAAVEVTGIGASTSATSPMRVLWRGVPVLTREAPPLALAHELLARDLDAAKNRMMEVAKQLQWDDCIETTLVISGSDVHIARAGSRDLCVRYSGRAEQAEVLLLDQFRKRLRDEGIPPGSEAAVRQIVGRDPPAGRGDKLER